jgi:cytidylate kinase
VYPVVCISGTERAGAEEVARIVAAGLGFRLIAEGIIVRAAREAGVEPHVVADVELRKPFLKRLVEDLGRTTGSAAAGGGVFVSGAEPGLSADDFRALIRAAIEETADQGNAVIVSHAASVALAGREDALRVLVTASPAVRCQRMADALELTAKAAARTVEEADAARADYLRRFYRIEVEAPTLYDLVISTDRLSVEQAAALVIDAGAVSSDSVGGGRGGSGGR